MAYEYYNPNPKGRKTGDCTVRALSKALNISWETAFIDLVMEAYELADMPSSNIALNAYLRSKGFSKHSIPDYCPSCFTFDDFTKEYPKGTYILGTGTHVATCIDSVIYDSWNSLDCVPLFYYKKEYETW